MARISTYVQKFESLRKELEVISQKNRFAILGVLLAAGKPISFSDLLDITEMNPANLSLHLKKLEEIGVITKMKKSRWSRNENRAFYKLSDKGKQILDKLGIGFAEDALKDWMESKKQKDGYT
ncbi:MAG: hypothetical protein DRO67_09840 [Candidatus Asgardarchaeum californiense]|nr:MAG: hypothetical protein DRO67_09840 [Candidatus Asgardarchaeum californiense]